MTKKPQKQHFLKVTDIETVKELTEQGYTLVDESGGVYTFIDDGTAVFSSKKVVGSNKLTF